MKYEERIRTEADVLAQELSAVSQAEGAQMREIKPKMLELIKRVVELEGTNVEKQVGDKGVVRFHAGDPHKPMNQGRLHFFEYVERTEEGEQSKAVAFMDPEDGGSWLMSEREQYGGPWIEDDIFAKDVEAAAKAPVGAKGDALIRANRFREMRVAARMARMLLGGAK